MKEETSVSHLSIGSDIFWRAFGDWISPHIRHLSPCTSSCKRGLSLSLSHLFLWWSIRPVSSQVMRMTVICGVMFCLRALIFFLLVLIFTSIAVVVALNITLITFGDVLFFSLQLSLANVLFLRSCSQEYIYCTRLSKSTMEQTRWSKRVPEYRQMIHREGCLKGHPLLIHTPKFKLTIHLAIQSTPFIINQL